MNVSKLLTVSLTLLLVGFLVGSAQAQFPKEGAGFAPTAPATIFTAVAYSDEDGKLIVYHVLRPGPFFTSTATKASPMAPFPPPKVAWQGFSVGKSSEPVVLPVTYA